MTISKQEFIKIALEEYKTLRNEIITKQSIIIGLINFSFAFIGVMCLASFNSKSLDIIYFCLVFAIPFIASFALAYSTFESVHIKKIGRYIAELENRINIQANQIGLFWEIGQRIHPEGQGSNTLYNVWKKEINKTPILITILGLDFIKEQKNESGTDNTPNKAFLMKVKTLMLSLLRVIFSHKQNATNENKSKSPNEHEIKTPGHYQLEPEEEKKINQYLENNKKYGKIRFSIYKFMNPIRNPFECRFDLIRITFLYLAMGANLIGFLLVLAHLFLPDTKPDENLVFIHSIINQTKTQFTTLLSPTFSGIISIIISFIIMIIPWIVIRYLIILWFRFEKYASNADDKYSTWEKDRP